MNVPRAVVVDIEGTVSPLSAVRDHLLPYARPRLRPWLLGGVPGTAAVVAAIRESLGEPRAPLSRVVDTVLDWHDRDRKDPPLKVLHGLIWHHGFAEGHLRAEVYPDVPPALRAWAAAGVGVWVYSSGSVLAQRQWFAHTDAGDLLDLFAGHFDPSAVGPKTDPGSYRRIGALIDADDVLFLSDSRPELDAARAAGWRTTGVSRPRDGRPDVGAHDRVETFAAVAPLPGREVARA
ncbi:acireductone synthase [Actinokineospora auranticolor]|uniref:Enolase-phosphatase E1 n=1 Tax=Actinokineospora auranticolor TaxID=155976 RepID=A0A2S6GD28_9PSEU|nr:acireductone synthase [Actinokineospora auranticolor]PPK63154.1 enolase-phosphatase E1 [Actinokineospora auranticolor]